MAHPSPKGPPEGPVAGISFREYQQGDIRACARLAREAWPAGPAIPSKEIEGEGMEGYMQYSLDASNWTGVASASEGLVGFLFGRIDGYQGRELARRSMLGEAPRLLRSMFDYEPGWPRLLGFVWSLALTDLKIALNTPRSDAAIEMFIVDSRFRGRGIGTRLLESFLGDAKKAGSSSVTVYTDELMSDWRFYERRGFTRVATFHDNITSHYSGIKARGVILRMGLEDVAPGIPDASDMQR